MPDNNGRAQLFHIKLIRLSFDSKYMQSWNLFFLHFSLFAGLFMQLCNQIPPKLCGCEKGKPSVYSFSPRHYKLSFEANLTCLEGQKYETVSLSFSSKQTQSRVVGHQPKIAGVLFVTSQRAQRNIV